MTAPHDLEHVRQIVRRSGTSFYWAMRLLPEPKRDAMFAIYAFCREIDDIADGSTSPTEKRQGLARWRQEIAAVYSQEPPTFPIARALVEPVRSFDLERAEFDALIDGMEMDVDEKVCAPPLERLRLYCRRVAGAVGLLAIRVFGCPSAEARRFAESLGEALQLTNILRDVTEDAMLGRLYLPREMLDDAGIAAEDPEVVLQNPALPQVLARLAEMAEARFQDSRTALSRIDRSPLLPAVIMMEIYHRILQRLTARGWDRLEPRVRLGRLHMLGLAVRLRLFGA